MTDSSQRNRPPTSSAPAAASSAPQSQQQEGCFALPGDLLVAWAETLVTRSRPYALQQPDGTYRWRNADCSPGLLVGHLAGTCTLALSCTDARGWCKWACLDADAPDALAALHQLRAVLAKQGLPGMLEASRRGGHLWLLLDAAVPAALLRQGVLAALDQVHQAGVDIWYLSLELDPDAASVQPGTLGHAVRLPLGIHRLTGTRYPLFEADSTPCVFTMPEAAMRWVLALPRVHAIDLAHLADRAVNSEHATSGQGLRDSHREHSGAQRAACAKRHLHLRVVSDTARDA